MSIRMLLIKLLISISFYYVSSETLTKPTTIVNTFSGPVRGAQMYTFFENQSYVSFKGIPYAEPPTNQRRYLPPEKIRAWSHIHDCFQHGPVCPQHNRNKTIILGSEDCLTLNIYTPDIHPIELKAVMIFIHGGAWYQGSGNTDLQGPDFLIEEDVILVTINYRLGFLGFLSLDTADYSGNQGIKDQQLAMQWIQENIFFFGGDSKQTTLIGFSAGSLACQFHTFSSYSRTLFQRSIQMSFTFDVWSVFERIDVINEMYRFYAVSTNATAAPQLNDLITFLQTVDMEQIFTQYPFERFNTLAMPKIEPANALWPIFQGTGEQLMYEHDFNSTLDVMTGFASAEAIQFGTEELFQNFIINFQTEIPSLKFNRSQYNTAAYHKATEKMYVFYFNETLEDTEETFRNYFRLKSDIYHRYRVDRTVQQLAKKSTGNIFYYQFGAETRLNYFRHLYKTVYELDGASHGDDLCYIFRCSEIDDIYANVTDLEYGLIKSMAGLYASFAKYGQPNWTSRVDGNILWSPVRVNKYNFLNISTKTARMDFDPFLKERHFWKDLLDEYSVAISKCGGLYGNYIDVLIVNWIVFFVYKNW